LFGSAQVLDDLRRDSGRAQAVAASSRPRAAAATTSRVARRAGAERCSQIVPTRGGHPPKVSPLSMSRASAFQAAP
jgi:hypothetical protein